MSDDDESEEDDNDDDDDDDDDGDNDEESEQSDSDVVVHQPRTRYSSRVNHRVSYNEDEVGSPNKIITLTKTMTSVLGFWHLGGPYHRPFSFRTATLHPIKKRSARQKKEMCLRLHPTKSTMTHWLLNKSWATVTLIGVRLEREATQSGSRTKSSTISSGRASLICIAAGRNGRRSRSFQASSVCKTM